MKEYIYSTGKRKTSIARVYLKKGNGNLEINKSNKYFIAFSKAITIIKKPLNICNLENKIDLKIMVKGGGITGQTEAIRHGVSKAVALYLKDNEDQSFKKEFKKASLLTRDSRIVERKKVGHRKSRKKEQYSKR